MNAKKYIISAVLAGVLVGCGGSNSSDSGSQGGGTEKPDTGTSSKLTILKGTEAFSASMQGEIDALDKEGWVDAKDSSIRSLSSNGSKIVAGSKYHNALSVIDMASKSEKYNPFASIKDSGHGIKSASGASENYLREAVVLKSGDIIVNVPPKSFSSKTLDKDTYGLFKTKINDDNSVQKVADSTRVKEKFSRFAVSKDEKTIVAYSSEDYLVSYDDNLQEKASLEVKGLGLFTFVDGSTMYGVFKDDQKKMWVSKITLLKDSITIDPNKITIENSADFIKFNGDNLILIDEDGKISVINVKDGSVKATDTKMTIDSVDISPNGKYLAVGGDKLNIINMNSKYKEVQFDLETETYVRAVTFINDTKLAYAKDRNEVAVIDIEDTKQIIPTEDILARYVENIEKEMNKGKSVEVIANDLNLAKTLNDATFTWTSSNPSVLSTEGKITRGNSDETVKLSVSAKKAGSEVVYKKDYDIVVKANLPKIPSKDVRRLPTEGKNRPDYMSVNQDGSMAISPVQVYSSDGKSSTYKMSSYKADENGKFTKVSKDKLYGGADMQVIGTGINGSFAIGLEQKNDKEEPKQKMYEGKIYSVAIDINGKLANSTANSLDINTGKPVRIEWNNDNTIAAVMIQKADKTYIAEIYKVNNSGGITLDHTINMGDTGYKTYGPIAVNEDGTKVYQRDGKGVHMVPKEGQSKFVEVDNIARVWVGAGRVFAHTYGGLIYSFDENLGNKKVYNTATFGRMYGGETRQVDGKVYYFVPVMRAIKDSLNGVYKFEVLDDGSLKGVGFNSLLDDNVTRGADRMGVSGDGKVIVYSSTTRS